MTQAQTDPEASQPDPSHLTAAGAESAKAGAELLAKNEPEDTRRLTIEELGDLIFGEAVSDPSWTGDDSRLNFDRSIPRVRLERGVTP